jgi:toxin YoeB
MQMSFHEEAWTDYFYWQETDGKILKRSDALHKDIHRSPFEGIGQPEPFRHSLSGFRSRRIDDERRLVYSISDVLLVASCRYHYQE